MNITVFGASGKVGRQVVDLALARGHHVTAFVHKATLAEHQNLRIVSGDIHETTDTAAVLKGTDAVISALGSWHTPQKNILSAAMQRLLPLMQERGIRRIVSLTGEGAQLPTEHGRIFRRLEHVMINGFAPKILRDSEDHIRMLEDSKLDWTVIRSPVMNEFGSQQYHLTTKVLAAWKTIHRRAVATCLVDQLDSTEFLQAAPFIARG